MTDKLTDLIVKFRAFIIVSTIVVVSIFGYFLKDIAVEGSYRIWFAKDSQIINNYDDFMDKFGSDSRAIIAFSSDKMFDKQTLIDIRDITDALWDMEHIARADSIINFPAIIVQDDEIVVQSYFEELDSLSQSQLNHIKKEILKNSAITGSILSKDGNATIISARLESQSAMIGGEVYTQISNDVKAILKPYEKKGYKFYITGDPIIQDQFVQIATTDGVLFTAISILSVISVSYTHLTLPTTPYV